jgi:hypothetical protein
VLALKKQIGTVTQAMLTADNTGWNIKLKVHDVVLSDD